MPSPGLGILHLRASQATKRVWQANQRLPIRQQPPSLEFKADGLLDVGVFVVDKAGSGKRLMVAETSGDVSSRKGTEDERAEMRWEIGGLSW